MRRMQRLNGSVTKTRSHEIPKRIHPQTPIPVTKSVSDDDDHDEDHDDDHDLDEIIHPHVPIHEPSKGKHDEVRSLTFIKVHHISKRLCPTFRFRENWSSWT